MAGPDGAELLAVSRLLLSASQLYPPSDAQLRRAVSTAYYAIFHTVLRAGARRFMGASSQGSAAYGLLYRGFSHGRMNTVCEALAVTTLSKSLQQQLGRSTVSQHIRDFANAFATLQAARHRADYDPAALFEPSNSAYMVDLATDAIAAFDQVTPDEKADVLALMLVGGRA